MDLNRSKKNKKSFMKLSSYLPLCGPTEVASEEDKMTTKFLINSMESLEA